MYAANVGRNGRGALILVASGNGAGAGDSCAFDGYATSVYTFTIGEQKQRRFFILSLTAYS